jgi:hypothetical protein
MQNEKNKGNTMVECEREEVLTYAKLLPCPKAFWPGLFFLFIFLSSDARTAKEL